MTDETRRLMLLMAKAAEDFYYEGFAYRCLLQGVPGLRWRENFDKLLADSRFRKQIHERFQPLYDNIQQAENVEKAVDEFLCSLPQTGSQN